MLPAADHPIWGLVSNLFKFVILAALMYASASQFDETEIQTLIGFLLASGATDGLRYARGKATTDPK